MGLSVDLELSLVKLEIFCRQQRLCSILIMVLGPPKSSIKFLGLIHLRELKGWLNQPLLAPRAGLIEQAIGIKTPMALAPGPSALGAGKLAGTIKWQAEGGDAMHVQLKVILSFLGLMTSRWVVD